MKTNKIFFCITTALIMSCALPAQTAATPAVNTTGYKTAVGLRAGETSGLTFKRFTGQSSALEFIFGAWPYGFSATGLYEKYAGTEVPGLNWYYGGGAHGAVQTGRVYYRYYEGRYYDYFYRTGGDAALGIDGVLGVEYKIHPIPFALSFDVKPFAEVNSSGDAFIGLDPGLGIKVVF